MSQTELDARCWKRKQVSLRLSDRRMVRLRYLASQMRAGATPTDVLDLAIEIATAPRFEPVASEAHVLDATTDEEVAQLIAIVEAALATRDSDGLAALTRLEDQLADISKKVADIANVIAAATASAEMDGDEHDSMNREWNESALSLSEWIERESKALALPIRQSVVIRAQWLATGRVSDAHVAIDFSANVVAIDGARPQNAQSPPSPFRVDMMRVDDDLSRIAPGRPLGFVCRLASGGRWTMEIFAIGENGATTPLLPSRMF